MTWYNVHRVWALVWHPRKTSLGVQTLCMAMLLVCAVPHAARADCPAAPIGDPDDMAISFLVANGVQTASASLLPSSVKEGILVYDDAANKLKVCDGTNWIAVGTGSGTDTLASLSCSSGQIAKYNGSAWACAADNGSGTAISMVTNWPDAVNCGWSSGSSDPNWIFMYGFGQSGKTYYFGGNANNGTNYVAFNTSTGAYDSTNYSGTLPYCAGSSIGALYSGGRAYNFLGGFDSGSGGGGGTDVLNNTWLSSGHFPQPAGTSVVPAGGSYNLGSMPVERGVYLWIVYNCVGQLSYPSGVGNTLDIVGPTVVTSSSTWADLSKFPDNSCGTVYTGVFKSSASGNVSVRIASYAGSGTPSVLVTPGPAANSFEARLIKISGGDGSSGGVPASPANSVQFNSAGVFGGDAALTWDNANKRLGIGAATPNMPLMISSDNEASVVVNGYAAGTFATGLRLFSGRGGSGATTPLQTSDKLGQISFGGFYSGKANNYFVAGDARAAVIGYASENWTGASNNGADLAFQTTPAGTASTDESMRITGEGNVGIGTSDPTHGAGYSSVQTVLGIVGNSNCIACMGALSLANGSTPPSGFDVLGTVDFVSKNSPGTLGKIGARIYSRQEGTGGANGYGASLVFNTKPDNGTMYREGMRIASTGNVGIGTSSPAFPLHVASDAPSSVIVISQAGDNTGTSILGFRKSRGTHASPTAVSVNDPAGQIDFNAYNDAFRGVAKIAAYADAGFGATGADAPGRLTFSTTPDGSAVPLERLTIAANGNVGIGTTSPATKLHVADSANAFIRLESGSGLASSILHFNGATAGSGLGLFPAADTRAFVLYNSTVSNSTPVMTGLQNGNVGIGTTAPTSKLDVRGNSASSIAVSAANESNNNLAWAGFRAQNDAGANGFLWVGSSTYNEPAARSRTVVSAEGNSNGVSIAAPLSGNDIRFYTTSYAEHMRITSGGNVGIGTTAPSYKLHVAGAVAGSSAYVNTSDVRLKKDVAPIPYGLADVIRLRPVAFQWKDQQPDWAKGRKIGLIAQEVEPVIPEVVSTAHDGMGTKSIAYGDLTPVLIQAIKELNDDNDNLRAELKSVKLKATNNYMELRREIDALKTSR